MTTLPDWIIDQPDPESLILSMAWLRNAGDLDAEIAASIVFDLLADAGEVALLRGMDRVAELVALAEHFASDPADAVASWNRAYTDCLSVWDASAMVDAFRGDAVTAASDLAAARVLRVVS